MSLLIKHELVQILPSSFIRKDKVEGDSSRMYHVVKMTVWCTDLKHPLSSIEWDFIELCIFSTSVMAD